MRAIVLLIVLSVSVYSQNKELTSVFDDGNRLYLAQKYDAAINQYESIIKNGYESGELFFNLGNAYFKTGRLQNAILNYERAKKFLPNDEDLDFNLQLSNLRLVDKVDPIPELFVYQWTDKILSLFAFDTLLTITYLFFLLTLTLFSLFLFASTYRQKRYTLLSGLICALFLVFGIIDISMQSYRKTNNEYAIVMTDVSNIKSAPDKTGNDVFVIHRGLKVQVLDNVNQWRKIRLADGKVGWIQEQEVEII